MFVSLMFPSFIVPLNNFDSVQHLQLLKFIKVGVDPASV